MDFHSSKENTLFFVSPLPTMVIIHGLMGKHVRNSFACESDFDRLNLSVLWKYDLFQIELFG